MPARAPMIFVNTTTMCAPVDGGEGRSLQLYRSLYGRCTAGGRGRGRGVGTAVPGASYAPRRAPCALYAHRLPPWSLWLRSVPQKRRERNVPFCVCPHRFLTIAAPAPPPPLPRLRSPTRSSSRLRGTTSRTRARRRARGATSATGIRAASRTSATRFVRTGTRRAGRSRGTATPKPRRLSVPPLASGTPPPPPPCPAPFVTRVR